MLFTLWCLFDFAVRAGRFAWFGWVFGGLFGVCGWFSYVLLVSVSCCGLDFGCYVCDGWVVVVGCVLCRV